MLGSLSRRINTFLLALVVMMAAAIIGILATRAGAGSLDPPGAPASTMHTLDDVYNGVQNVPQVWDQKLDSTNGSGGGATLPAGCNSDRFACVFRRVTGPLAATYDGVLDRETGLVWERSPSSTAVVWSTAVDLCIRATTGGRSGWRLPTVEELSTLMVPSGSASSLPAGNPFSGVSTSELVWSSTEVVDDATPSAWVFPIGGSVGGYAETNTAAMWCVRGGLRGDGSDK
jgi:hypothetical protein